MTTVVVLTNVPAPYTCDLVGDLNTAGVEAHLVARHTPAELGRPWPVPDRPDVRVTGSGGADRREVRSWLARAGSDDVHLILTGGYAGAVDIERRLATVRGRARVWFWGERLSPPTPTRRLVRRLWFGAPGLDGILAVGDLAARHYRQLSRRRTAVHVFPYTTDIGLGAAPTPADRPTIGVAGRLLPYKGVDLVVRALARLSDDHRPALEVAGSGPEAAPLRRLAADEGVEVNWLGSLTPDQLTATRRRWWVEVVPSRRSEGWGVVVAEALNSGVPVIASEHVLAAGAWVRPGLDGAVVAERDVENPSRWAEAIMGVVGASDQVRHDLASSARRVGAAAAAGPAASWLRDLLADPPPPGERRSFVDDTWRRLAEGPGPRHTGPSEADAGPTADGEGP